MAGSVSERGAGRASFVPRAVLEVSQARGPGGSAV